MHIPDGFINGATSAGAAVVAAGGVGVAIKQSGRDLNEKQIPFAGLAAAFIFALQMLNFPVAAGTSGHLIGGALAAILLGPWVGIVAVAVVVMLQALLFADGGVSALGLNMLNMAIVTVAVAWPLFRGLVRVLPKSHAWVLAAAMVSAWASVVASSIAFAFEYAIGGQGGVDPGTVFAAMVGVHAVIGIGEGLITAVTVGAVLAVRPDLVFGTRDLGLAPDGAQTPSRAAVGAFIGFGLAAAAMLVIFVAPLASPSPDGLEFVAEETGFIDTAADHPIGGPLADYGVAGLESEQAGTIVAGLVGLLLTFGVSVWLVTFARRRSRTESAADV
ncbi:MAG: energy-coupling factor ABC transporter permease [Acidimicrobiia bacterium]